jgi:hypothetical protein
MTAGASNQQHVVGTTAEGAGNDASSTQPDSAVAPLFVASLEVRWRDLDAFNHVNAPNSPLESVL